MPHRISPTQTWSTEKTSEGTIAETPVEKSKTEGNDGLSKGVERDFPDGGLRACCTDLGDLPDYVQHVLNVFQAYYEEPCWVTLILPLCIYSTNLYSSRHALVFMAGLVTGRMFDIGHFKLKEF
ncbi:hypothetical protein EDD85DRAFT_785370 [Armillaria nabsnona]|nr:hypothetical protein EDD85DRAFT_785370 [Armillaria nabsnona]